MDNIVLEGTAIAHTASGDEVYQSYQTPLARFVIFWLKCLSPIITISPSRYASKEMAHLFSSAVCQYMFPSPCYIFVHR